MPKHSYMLYVMTGCPYCARVKDFLAEKGIEVPVANISTDAAAREELVRVGGKAQVPCLFIDGEPLYESGDIIAHFAAELGEADAAVSEPEGVGEACTFDPATGTSSCK